MRSAPFDPPAPGLMMGWQTRRLGSFDTEAEATQAARAEARDLPGALVDVEPASSGGWKARVRVPTWR